MQRYPPMLCLVVQGAKQIVIGDRMLDYDPGRCPVTCIEVPASGRIVETCVEKPYRAITLVFEQSIIAELLDRFPYKEDDKLQAGFTVGAVSSDLSDMR